MLWLSWDHSTFKAWPTGLFLNSSSVYFTLLSQQYTLNKETAIHHITVPDLQFKDLINRNIKCSIFLLLMHILSTCKPCCTCSNLKCASSLYLLPVISVSTSVETNSCWSCSLPSSYTNPRPFEATSWLSSAQKSNKIVLV